jgi:L-asparaginase II
MQMAVPVVNVYRGDIVESVHYGNLAVVSAEGKLLYSAGDPYAVTYLRSAAKPFQIVPLVESGAMRKYDFNSSELAVMCSSHSGEPIHADTVGRILGRVGLGPEHLKCGVHEPLYYSTNNVKPPADIKYDALNHNCSGKHAGMLVLCAYYNHPVENYLDFDHPIQKMITETVSNICKIPIEKMSLAIDGCSAPVHGMPLFNMAYGYARFVSPNSVVADKAKTFSIIYRAMMEHPEMVGGTNRYDTALMTTCHGKLLAKGGAEGVHCVGLTEKGMALAAKITDGNKRAVFPFSLEALVQLGVVDESQLETLKQFHRPIVRNSRQLDVGQIKADFKLEPIA